MTGAIAPFVHDAPAMRVVSGSGSIQRVTDETDRLELGRVVVVCTPEQDALGQQMAAHLGSRSGGVMAQARMHVPADTVAGAIDQSERWGADGYLAAGGGSAIGLAKALALHTGLPIIALPTTYAGSEMTPVWGITDAGVKKTGRDPKVLPRSVIYDPDLTVSLPASLSVTSGFNAMAHAVEALYAPDTTPLVALMAEAGVRAFAHALPAVTADTADVAARTVAQYGSWMCGACLGMTTMSLHHKLCHALGGLFDLPHSETHTVVLPHALAYNEASVPETVTVLSRALGMDGAAAPSRRLWELAGELGAARSLRELGLAETDLHAAAQMVTRLPYANPRPVDQDAALTILHAAWLGESPSAS